MDSYASMYYKLFNRITDVIQDLQAVQQEAEELFLAQQGEQRVTSLPVKCKDTR